MARIKYTGGGSQTITTSNGAVYRCRQDAWVECPDVVALEFAALQSPEWETELDVPAAEVPAPKKASK